MMIMMMVDGYSMILFIFRSGIPVVIMGETGCGKTRLVKFMCDLQRKNISIYSADDTAYDLKEKDEAVDSIKNLYLFKVRNETTGQCQDDPCWRVQHLLSLGSSELY